MSFPIRPSPGARSRSERSNEYEPPQSRMSNPSIITTRSKSSGQSQEAHTSYFLAAIDDLYRLECDTWAFETLSIVVSLAALGTVIFALYHYDGKPAPDWPYSLTLNAFISVCMMIMGAALTVPVSNGLGQLKWLLARQGDISIIDLDSLDRASRGMWGSLCVIFGLTGGILGSLGSFITIALFAIAPFAQQAIFSSVGGIETMQDATTFVSTCGPASAISNLCSETSISGSIKKGQSVVPSLLRGAYYNAVYGTYNQSVAPLALVTCPTRNCTWEPFPTISLCSKCNDVTNDLVLTKSTAGGATIATLPNGPALDTSFDNFALGTTNVADYVLGKRAPSHRIPQNNVTAFTFAVLESSANRTVSAIECALSFCVQLIEAKFSGGVYEETILQEFHESSLKLGFTDASKKVRSFNDYLVFGPLETRNGTQYPSMSVEKRQPVCLGEVFEFNPREELTLTEMGIQNINAMVNNLAISVSRGIRTVCTNSTRLAGSSWNNVTLVRINWPWLILPLAVEILGFSFFLWVSISNKLSHTKIWKSSLVAALYHGPELASNGRGEAMDMEGLFDMESVAGKMKVMLSDSHGGIRGGDEMGVRSRLLVRRSE